MTEDKSVRNVLMGFLIGSAAILPGVSGGIIAVLCGVYERAVKDISDIWHKWRPEFWFLATLGTGVVLGVLTFAVGLDFIITNYEVPAMFLFMGLITAQIPELYKIARNEEPIKPRYAISFIIGFILMIILFLVDNGGAQTTELDYTLENVVLLIFCGIIMAISKIVPGISGSALLLALGLYQITISAMAHLDMYFLIPIGIGVIIGILGFAKIMTYLLENYHSLTYYMILGLTVSSLLIIYPGLETATDAAIGIGSFVLGFVASLLFNVYGKRIGNGNIASS
ncbi:MAG: DUF368 domain-containing protein [Candidatus Methanomethylophilaceae archaeon]